MKIELQKSSSLLQAQCLLVFTAKLGDKKKAKIGTRCDDITAILTSACHEGTLFGDWKELCLFRNADVSGGHHLLSLGLGEKKKATLEDLRQGVTSALNMVKANKFKNIHIDIDSASQVLGETNEVAAAMVEGLILGHYKFDKYKNKGGSNKKKGDDISVTLVSSSIGVALKKSVAQAQIVCESVNFARVLGDTPGNLMTPENLAKATQRAAKGTALKVTVWNKDQIKREKMGGLYGVSLGSSVEPRFIIMEYKGAAASKKPICFVGKGITFDSGGISLKPGANMDEMKYDMCGGANVIATMVAIAKLELKVNAIAYVPASENMPGPLANKPGDILRARNGKTVEVLNTDAEGRLILMDALCYASEKKPAAIIDVATLTGAILAALGKSYTGVFTRNEVLLGKIQKASQRAGEGVWPMPICQDYVEAVKGVHADLSNLSSSRGAGSSTAAAFLEQFVDSQIPWAHFDIAGTGWNMNSKANYHPKKGASGCMVRTFVELSKMF